LNQNSSSQPDDRRLVSLATVSENAGKVKVNIFTKIHDKNKKKIREIDFHSENEILRQK